MKFLNIILLLYIIDCHCNCASLPGFEELENKLKDTRELLAKKRDEIVGASLNPRVGAAIQQQKDNLIDQKKKRCEFCRNTNRCKNQGKCDLCEKICNDLPQTIETSPIDVISENENTKNVREPIVQKMKKRLANKENEPILGQSFQRRLLKKDKVSDFEPVLQARFGGDDETQMSPLADWQNRFYTVAQFNPGPQMNLLMRLAKVKDKAYIDKLIILAKAKSKSGVATNGDPIIVDTAKVIVPPKSQPPTLHRVDGAKLDKDNSELASDLIGHLDKAMDENKKKGGDGRLSPQEIDKIIDTALESVKNKEDKNTVGDSLDDANDKEIVASGDENEAVPINPQNLDAEENKSISEPSLVGTTNEETVACSNEEEVVPMIPSNHYREAETSKPELDSRNGNTVGDFQISSTPLIDVEKVGAIEENFVDPSLIDKVETLPSTSEPPKTHIQIIPDKISDTKDVSPTIHTSEDDKKSTPPSENQEKLNSPEDNSSEEKGTKPSLKTRIQERLKLKKNNKNKPDGDRNNSSPEKNSSEETDPKPSLKTRIQEQLKNKNPALFKNLIHEKPETFDKIDAIEKAAEPDNVILQPESTLEKSNPENVKQSNPENVKQSNPENVKQSNPENVKQSNPDSLVKDIMSVIKPNLDRADNNQDQLSKVEETLAGAGKILEKLNSDTEQVSKMLISDNEDNNPENTPIDNVNEPLLESRVANDDKDVIGIVKPKNDVNLDEMQMTDAEKKLINRNQFEPEKPQTVGARLPTIADTNEDKPSKISERKEKLAARKNERRKKLEDRKQQIEARRRNKEDDIESDENKLQEVITNLKNRNSVGKQEEPVRNSENPLEDMLAEKNNNEADAPRPSLKEILQQRRNKTPEKTGEDDNGVDTTEEAKPSLKERLQQRLNKNQDKSLGEKNIVGEEVPEEPARPPLIRTKPKIKNDEKTPMLVPKPAHPNTKPLSVKTQKDTPPSSNNGDDQSTLTEKPKKIPIIGKSAEKPTIKDILQQRLDERKQKLAKPKQDDLLGKQKESEDDMESPDIKNRNQFDKQQDEIVGLSPEEEEVLHHFGKIVPVNKNGDVVGNPKEASNVFFLGKGIKLPLKMQATKDGSVQLSVDINKLCNCPNSTCPANFLDNNIRAEQSDIVGAGNPVKDADVLENDSLSLDKENGRIKRSADENVDTVVENTITKSNKDETSTLSMKNTFDEMTKEENDEISQIKDLHKFRLLEEDLEQKLEKLNARMRNYFDQIDITERRHIKHDVDSEMIHKRVKLVNDMLKWMKSLYSKK